MVGRRSLFPDLTAMAGVALLIVLMMMMSATHLLKHEQTPIEVPKARSQDVETEDNYTIALLTDNSLRLNDEFITREELGIKLQNKLVEDPYYLIIVRADRRVPAEWVMDIISLAKKAGGQRVAVATKPVKQEG